MSPTTTVADSWDDAEMASFAQSVAGALAPRVAEPPRASATRTAVLSAFAAARLGQPSRRPAIRLPGRLATSLSLAGLLLFAGAAGIAASSAGGPLYGLRLAVEAVTLPASGPGRQAADVERLGLRLDEIRAATARNDGGALVASLDAFAGIASETAAVAVPDAAEATRVAAQLQGIEQVPAGSAGVARARQGALDAGARLVAALGAGAAPEDPRNPAGSGPDPSMPPGQGGQAPSTRLPPSGQGAGPSGDTGSPVGGPGGGPGGAGAGGRPVASGPDASPAQSRDGRGNGASGVGTPAGSADGSGAGPGDGSGAGSGAGQRSSPGGSGPAVGAGTPSGSAAPSGGARGAGSAAPSGAGGVPTGRSAP